MSRCVYVGGVDEGLAIRYAEQLYVRTRVCGLDFSPITFTGAPMQYVATDVGVWARRLCGARDVFVCSQSGT